jgi:hypothetical protein
VTERKVLLALRETCRFAQAKRFAPNCSITDKLLAKLTIDNCQAGRAAKGSCSFHFFLLTILKGA